tara:strand:+ start:224 stop:676 length:453 start_codon:yes stop_codon:yes gene_type:complete
MALPLIPLAVAGAGVIARFIAKKGMKEAVKKYGKKAVTEVQKNAKDMVTKPTAGQAGTKAGVRGMRNARQLGRQAAGVGAAAGAVGGVVAMKNKVKDMRQQVKLAKTEAKRAQMQTAIEKTLAKIAVAEQKAKPTAQAPKKSMRPKARPK